MSTQTILVVDDDPQIRDILGMALERAGFEAVMARDGTEGLEKARTIDPALAVLDIGLPEMDGLEATARILAEGNDNTRIIILTTFDPDEYVYKALQAGASGFVLKSIPPEELVAAVRTIAAGGAMLAPTITRRLIGRFAGQLGVEGEFAERLERLTAREREVLQALADGKSNVEIAEKLFIGAATVKTHVSSLLSKLGLRDRAQAVVFAYECGLAKVGERDVGF